MPGLGKRVMHDLRKKVMHDLRKRAMLDLRKRAILNHKRLVILAELAECPSLCLPPSRRAAKSSVPKIKTVVKSSTPAATGIPQCAELGDLQQLRMQHELKSMAIDTSWKTWQEKSHRIKKIKASDKTKGEIAAEQKYEQVKKVLRLMGNPSEEWQTLFHYRKWGSKNKSVAYRVSRPGPTPRVQYGRLGARLGEKAAKKRVDEKFGALATRAYWFNEVYDGDEWDLPAQLDEVIQQAAFRQKIDEGDDDETIYQEAVQCFVPEEKSDFEKLEEMIDSDGGDSDSETKLN